MTIHRFKELNQINLLINFKPVFFIVEQYRLIRAGQAANRGYPLTPSEIGCTLSHLIVYQKIIDKQLSWACILEDEVILDERIKVFIEKFDSSNLNP